MVRGGGKTLLATQVLGSIYSTILEKRNGTALVLWVVPSDQIYKDTLKALRDRNHFYRFSLEHAVSRRVEVWEKQADGKWKCGADIWNSDLPPSVPAGPEKK